MIGGGCIVELEQMSLQAFIRSIKYNTWLFEKEWLNNHSDEPEEWPLQLPIHKWVEQIGIWAEQQDLNTTE